MKKLYVVALALVAVFSFSAIAVSSAFAATPEWLVKGLTFVGELETETSGSLKLIHLAGGFLEPEAVIECTGIFDGTIKPGEAGGQEGLVTAVLTSGGGSVSLASPLICKAVKTCEKPSGGEDASVVPQNLPWLTTLSLMATGKAWLILFSEEKAGSGKPAYEISCLVLGSVHETLCEGETSAFLELSPDLLGVFNAKELEEEKLEGLCEEGGTNHENVALQEGSGLISLTNNAEELSVSQGSEEA